MQNAWHQFPLPSSIPRTDQKNRPPDAHGDDGIHCGMPHTISGSGCLSYNSHTATAPYDSYQAKDGQVIIACGNQKLYEKLCNEVLHMPWMITDERFLTVSLRVQNNEIQKKYIEEWTTQYTVNEIVENVLAKGIPAGPIYNVRQITEDKHIAIEREMFVEIEHPVIGKMKVNGNPIKLMDNMPEISKPAPTLGQHNEEIFCGLLKHSEEQIKEWRKHNIICYVSSIP